MALFLTQDQVIELTGYKKQSCQISYLTRERIPFRINGMGKPIVVKSDVPILRSNSKVEISGDVMPDLDAMRALRG